MFASPLQPLDETPATLVPADCPRPWATTYPARQRCVVTRGARISHPFSCRTTATTFPPASRSKFAAVAQISARPCCRLLCRLPLHFATAVGSVRFSMAVFAMMIARTTGTVVSLREVIEVISEVTADDLVLY